jgi:cell division protein FtsL
MMRSQSMSLRRVEVVLRAAVAVVAAVVAVEVVFMARLRSMELTLQA